MKRVSLVVLIALCCLFTASTASAENTDPKRTVSDGSRVTLKYTLIADRVLMESSDDGGPLVFTVGEGKVLPGLEREVIGMRIGQVKEFVLEPDEAYGRATELVREIPLSALPEGVEIKESAVLLYDDPQTGRKRYITIVQVKEKSAVVDFNHPLAGKQLFFRVKVLDIE